MRTDNLKVKRLVKYWQRYKGDEAKFSTCSTEYEVLPYLVSYDDGDHALISLAIRLGYEMTGPILKPEEPKYGYRQLQITHAVQVGTKKTTRWNETEEVPVYLGFITLANGSLKPVPDCTGTVDADQGYAMVGMTEYGIDDVGETVDGGVTVVKSGWDYYHHLPMLGYSLESFETAMGITDGGFHDDTIRCDACNKYDSRDNGYTYNHRYVDSKGTLGINCGCYDEYASSPEALFDYVNQAESAMELSAAEEHAKAGRLKHIERFIGGMVDGRGGSYGGKYCREGSPDKILADLRAKFPKSDFVFTHDESGQFQTYFSVWRVVKAKMRRPSKRTKRRA